MLAREWTPRSHDRPDKEKPKMLKRILPALAFGALAFAFWGGAPAQAKAGDTPLTRFHYYPYYNWPANYWPSQGPKWPEAAGAPYMRPPAYMAYPPFLEPRWRYELWQPQKYYRGSHFWLDQF
jgi:hypothetical protein